MINSLEGLSLPELYRLRENVNNEIIKRKMQESAYNPLKQNKGSKNVFSNKAYKILEPTAKTPPKATKSLKTGKKLVVIGGHRRVWVCNNCKNIVLRNQTFCNECGVSIENKEE